jgi:hypothetical protein
MFRLGTTRRAQCRHMASQHSKQPRDNLQQHVVCLVLHVSMEEETMVARGRQQAATAVAAAVLLTLSSNCSRCSMRSALVAMTLHKRSKS